jgi:hypothetical protein
MSNLTSGAGKKFRSLLDAVTADEGLALHTSLSESVRGDTKEPDASALGPSVGDDAAPSPPSVTMLGPSVGDDGPPSDLRLKQDVRRVGTTVFGLPLYHFKYIGAPETYEGVMAQDVLHVMPSAVSRGADGYYRVNYNALGTNMRQIH